MTGVLGSIGSKKFEIYLKVRPCGGTFTFIITSSSPELCYGCQHNVSMMVTMTTLLCFYNESTSTEILHVIYKDPRIGMLLYFTIGSSLCNHPGSVSDGCVSVDIAPSRVTSCYCA